MSMCPDAWLPNCQGPPHLSPPLLRSPCSFWGMGTRRAASQGCSLQAAPVRRALLEAAKLLERPVYTCCLPSSPPISSSTHCFLTCSAPSNDPTSALSPAHRLGWRRTRWKRPEQPPEDSRPAPGSPPSCLSPVPCLSTSTHFGLKTPSGIVHGRRDLDTPPSTLRCSNPSAATGTPCTRPRGTGRTQRLWTRAAPCEEGQALLASPCVATRPLADGLH
ncbi:LOW QUALITY PROTEIN: uncharacterized protein LOC116856219 [Lontra canadensis]|uniref:LOW QUALITY PROTEIN: uncharacterized protein LOC116856219 n=1 Tax=Lontra canadensis TaxID=76717 RepID=UPI0013F3079C|nr:LOW QUALITY PROTEIN: uncharacterized protein LOC116856219 [Lontra canadensis]